MGIVKGPSRVFTDITDRKIDKIQIDKIKHLKRTTNQNS